MNPQQTQGRAYMFEEHLTSVFLFFFFSIYLSVFQPQQSLLLLRCPDAWIFSGRFMTYPICWIPISLTYCYFKEIYIMPALIYTYLFF